MIFGKNNTLQQKISNMPKKQQKELVKVNLSNVKQSEFDDKSVQTLNLIRNITLKINQVQCLYFGELSMLAQRNEINDEHVSTCKLINEKIDEIMNIINKSK